ncbi:MAG TPA: hypothetical protein VKM94_02895 [Blastocatellia bacterium]|nr:hypothetical protein [Blastocatellia bacterium]
MRNRPYRFRKLIEVAWHCYFNHTSPTQSSIAEMMGISDSLVSHYRRIFDSLVQKLNVTVDEMLLLDSALEKLLSAIKAEFEAADPRPQSAPRQRLRKAYEAEYQEAADCVMATQRECEWRASSEIAQMATA